MLKYITKHKKTGAIVDVTLPSKLNKPYKKGEEIFPGIKQFDCETYEVDDDFEYEPDLNVFQLAACLLLIENRKDKDIKFICRFDVSFLDISYFGKIGYIFDVDNERKYFISSDENPGSISVYTEEQIETFILKTKDKILKLEEQISEFQKKMKKIEKSFDFCGIESCKFFPKNKEEVYCFFNGQMRPCFGCIYYKPIDFYKK